MEFAQGAEAPPWRPAQSSNGYTADKPVPKVNGEAPDVGKEGSQQLLLVIHEQLQQLKKEFSQQRSLLETRAAAVPSSAVDVDADMPPANSSPSTGMSSSQIARPAAVSTGSPVTLTQVSCTSEFLQMEAQRDTTASSSSLVPGASSGSEVQSAATKTPPRSPAQPHRDPVNWIHATHEKATAARRRCPHSASQSVTPHACSHHSSWSGSCLAGSPAMRQRNTLPKTAPTKPMLPMQSAPGLPVVPLVAPRTATPTQSFRSPASSPSGSLSVAVGGHWHISGQPSGQSAIRPTSLGTMVISRAASPPPRAASPSRSAVMPIPGSPPHAGFRTRAGSPLFSRPSPLATRSMSPPRGGVPAHTTSCVAHTPAVVIPLTPPLAGSRSALTLPMAERRQPQALRALSPHRGSTIASALGHARPLSSPADPRMPSMPPGMMSFPSVARSRSTSPSGTVLKPAEIARRKEDTQQVVHSQLQKGVEQLNDERKKRQSAIKESAAEDKRQHDTLVDQHVKSREFALTQNFKEQIMRLTQAAHARRADQQKQACAVHLGYQQKKLEDVYIAQQSQIEQEYLQQQASINSEIAVLQAQCAARPPLVTSDTSHGPN